MAYIEINRVNKKESFTIMLNILHLTNGISHSSAPLRLKNALKIIGVNSKILVLNKNYDDDDVLVYHKNNIEKVKNRYISFLEKEMLNKYDSNNYPFSFGWSGIDLSKQSLIKEADVIHLHWINGQYLSYRSINNLICLGKPIVWTFHDSWAMTGGCHVRYGCSNFKIGCGRCHELNSTNSNDITKLIFEKKRRYYHADKITTISPSAWMYHNVCESMLFRNSNNYQIGNPLDTELFTSSKKDRKDNQIKILFGSSGLAAKHKGTSFFLDAMKKIKADYPDITKKIIIQIFGTEEKEYAQIDGYKVELLGVINTEVGMAITYQNADIYVFPSLDDNLPGTVMESLSCSTPVVCFKTGGVPEMVQHKINGYVAKYKNVEDLAKGIIWVISNNLNNCLGINGRRWIVENYNQKKIAKEYLKVYEEL